MVHCLLWRQWRCDSPLYTSGTRRSIPGSCCRACLACCTCQEHHEETAATGMMTDRPSSPPAACNRVHMAWCHCLLLLDCTDTTPDHRPDRWTQCTPENIINLSVGSYFDKYCSCRITVILQLKINIILTPWKQTNSSLQTVLFGFMMLAGHWTARPSQ